MFENSWLIDHSNSSDPEGESSQNQRVLKFRVVDASKEMKHTTQNVKVIHNPTPQNIHRHLTRTVIFKTSSDQFFGF
jgi:hypothetical protein